MTWQDRITVNSSVLAGKPIIRGTRMSVEFVIDLLGRGWSIERVLQEYDHLSPADIQACLAYASEVLKSERVYLIPELVGKFAVVTDDRVRIRPLPDFGS